MRFGESKINSLFKTKFFDHFWRNSVLILFALLLIVILKVSFGGSWELVTLATIFNATVILVLSSISIGFLVTLWEKSNGYQKSE
jgi:hypothetical protein